jgi:hypothetical protein
MFLYLLSSPARICLAHVLRGLDGRNKFKSHISNTNYANNSSEDDIEDVGIKKDGADENVNLECQFLPLR